MRVVRPLLVVLRARVENLIIHTKLRLLYWLRTIVGALAGTSDLWGVVVFFLGLGLSQLGLLNCGTLHFQLQTVFQLYLLLNFDHLRLEVHKLVCASVEDDYSNLSVHFDGKNVVVRQLIKLGL